MVKSHPEFKHFSKGISHDIRRFGTNTALKFSKYVFTHKEGKQQLGYCTHCKKEYKTERLRHNEKWTCPRCKSGVQVKSAGYGRKYLFDEAYFVYYEKSKIDPQVIVARGFCALRDYSQDYKAVKTIFDIRAKYCFTVGSSHMFYRSYWNPKDKFYKTASIYSLSNSGYIAKLQSEYSYESLCEAIKGTPYEYVRDSLLTAKYGLSSNQHLKEMDLYSKKPCVEYLVKCGYHSLVDRYLWGERNYSTINWKAKKVNELLRLSKEAFNRLKAEAITFEELKLIQHFDRQSKKWTIEQVRRINKESNLEVDDLVKILKHTTYEKANNYTLKQFDKDKKTKKSNKGTYYAVGEVWSFWRDYLQECKGLGYNLQDEMIVHPKSLSKAHERTAKLIVYKENKELDVSIRKRAQVLKKYEFEYEGLIIKVPMESKEIINEGATLHHCVGGYIKRHAKGNTSICFIRKIKEQDKPFFTMEISNNVVHQIRGLNNSGYRNNKQLCSFIDAFKKAKLDKKNIRKAG